MIGTGANGCQPKSGPCYETTFAIATYLAGVIFAFQVIAAVLVLVNRYIPLAVAVLAPVIVNILFFPRFDGPERASAGRLSGCTVGGDIRRCATGLCRLAAAATA